MAVRDLLQTVRRSVRAALPRPSLSLIDIIYEGRVHRFRNLSHVLGAIDVIELAISRLCDELGVWWELVFGKEYDRELRNHDPWGEAGGHCDPAAFEQ